MKEKLVLVASRVPVLKIVLRHIFANVITMGLHNRWEFSRRALIASKGTIKLVTIQAFEQLSPLGSRAHHAVKTKVLLVILTYQFLKGSLVDSEEW